MELYPIPKEFKVKSDNHHQILTLKNNNLHPFSLFSHISMLALASYYLFNFLYHFNLDRWLFLLVYVSSVGVFSFHTWIDVWAGFGSTELRLNNTVLTIEKRLFKLSKIEQVDRIKMINFYQLKDDFRTPSWSLKLKTNQGKIICLVIRQPIEVSDWLGRLLADRYQVEFIPTDFL